MKNIFKIFIFVFLFSLAITKTLACECIVNSLDNRFRKAKAVFIGKVADSSEIPNDNDLIQGDGIQTLKVIKSWKGVKKKFIDVNFDFESAKYGGMCPTLLHLKENREYLIFVYGTNYQINTVCTDTRTLVDSSNQFFDYQQKQIKRLDDFWFRFWSRLIPF